MIWWSPATGSSSPAASATTSRGPRGRAAACGRRRRAPAAAGRRPGGACGARSAARTRRPRCSPSSLHLEQLEVRQHRRERRAQLVRRVRDELALAGERRLGLAARLVERVRACSPASARARRPRRRTPGGGSRRGSRVRSIARAVSVQRDRRHRAASRSPGRRAAPAPPPPSTPRPRNTRTRLAAPRRPRAGAYCT